MKAVLCKQFGPIEDLVVEDIPNPQIRKGHVKVRMRACGVSFPDVLMVQGLYQFKPEFPFSPGVEIAGDVIEVGDDVTAYKVGDRVIGSLSTGGFAEEVLLPVESLFAMPDSMSYEHGASFLMNYGTSHVALAHRGQLQAGETLLVLGAAGGVGITAVELGKVMGATVIAAASTDEKLALTRDYGADHTINYTQQDLRDTVKDITGGQFADVIYDPVGGDIFDTAVRCMGWESRYLVIGFASGRIPSLPANRVLLKNSSLVGVFWGAYAMRDPSVMQRSFETLFQWYGEGKLKPHVDRAYPLENAADALNAIANREAKGKIIVTP